MQLVHQRELQMAGGMVAAWQRLAESADQELARTRKLNTAAWITVGVLGIAMIAGVGAAVWMVSDARSQRALTQADLTRATDDLGAAVAAAGRQRPGVGVAGGAAGRRQHAA